MPVLPDAPTVVSHSLSPGAMGTYSRIPEKLGGDMSPGVGRSLTSAGFSSLGSLARNALLSDLVEALCWPLESVIDRGKPFNPFRAV
jgi:hypothetical protein